VQPACRTCKSLHIDCVYSERRPDWMDGDEKRKQRMAIIKMQVKENASHRRERQVLQSIDEPFIITSESDFNASSQDGNGNGRAAQPVQPLSVDETPDLGYEDGNEIMTGHEPSPSHAMSFDMATLGIGQSRTSTENSSSVSPLGGVERKSETGSGEARSPVVPAERSGTV
jgi:hypothetical protein